MHHKLRYIRLAVQISWLIIFSSLAIVVLHVAPYLPILRFRDLSGSLGLRAVEPGVAPVFPCGTGSAHGYLIGYASGYLPVDLLILIIILSILLCIGLISGRLICSWLCPIGTVQDLLSGLRTSLKISHIKVPPALHIILINIKFALLFLLVLIALSIGLTSYSSAEVGNMLKTQFPELAANLPICYVCPVPVVLFSMPTWLLGGSIGQTFGDYCRFYIILISFLAGTFMVPRAYCRYFCPAGAILAPFNKLSILKVKMNTNKCIECKCCNIESVCAMNMEKLNLGVPGKTTINISRATECILCLNCIGSCPENALWFTFRNSSSAPRRARRSWKRIRVNHQEPRQNRQKAVFFCILVVAMVVGGVIANTFNVTAHGCHCTPVYEDPPEIDFYANATVGVVPLHVKFYAINTGGSVEQWYWEFGDGATSAERDPIHIYEVPGSYTVSLTATGPGGTDIATKHNYINAQALPEPPPDIDFEATPVSGYAPLTVNFVATNTGGLVEQWFWDFGDGNTSTLQDPTHVYETAGNYTVCLQATGPGGTDIERKEDYITIWKRIDEETLIEAPPTTELVLQATEELIIEGVHTLSCNITLSGWAKLIIEVTGTFNLTGNVTITKFAELRILGTYKQHGDIILSDWAMLIVDGGTMELFGDMCLEAHTVWVVQNDGRVIINLSTTPIRRPLPLTEERGWMHGEVYMSFTAKIVIKHSVVELNLPAGERKRYAIMCRGTIELINVELNSNAPAALEILGSLVTKRSIISGVSLTSSATATIETTTIGKLALNQMLQGGAEPPTAAVVHVRKSHIITIVAARDSNLMLYDTYVEELYAYDDAIITLQRAECATAYIYDNVTVTFIDAIVDMLTLTDNAYGTGCNTTFHSLYITAYAIVSVATSSMIYDLYADEHAILELLTCSVLKNYQLLNNSIIYYNHTLSVELTLNDKPLAGIKINIYELTDTFVKSITTDMMGKAEIRLAERIITHSSTRADLAYIVRVCVGQWAKSVTVNLTEDTFIPFRFIDRVPPNINKINLEVVQDALLVIYVEAYDEGYGIENITAICSIIEPERGSKLVRVPLQPISKSVYQTTIENLQAGSEIKVKVIVYDGAGNVNMSGWQTVVVGLMPWYYKTYAITLAIALGTAVVVVIAIHSIKKYLSKRRYLMREPRE